MSAGARRAERGARARFRPGVDLMFSVAEDRATSAGCNCKPTITLRPMGAGVTVAEVAHEAWCKHPSQQGRKR